MSESGEKLYKIGQAAKEVGLKTYVLRFWETEFDKLQPVRTPTGQRMYTEEHIGLLRTIKSLLYDEGLTIEGARKRLDTDRRSRNLQNIYDELREIKKMLE